ncbi:MAG: LysR family transcriptional regulator [Paracoccaceae bacterium]
MQPHWDDLRVFLAVARESSLSGAGKRLRVDPATIGRRIARLEANMGVDLFAKSPQGYVMSDIGQRLLVRAEAAELAMQAVAELPGAADEGLSGQIRLGAPDGSANYLLPQVCAAICDENPNLDLQIVALPRVFNLSRREADVVIGVSAPTSDGLHVERLTDYKLHLMATQDYLLSHPPIHALDDLHQHRIIGYIPDMIFDSELDYLSNLGLKRVALSSNSVSVQINMVRQGSGVGVIHDFAAPAVQGLRKILPDQISLTRSFYLIRHKNELQSVRMNRFAELLTTRVADEVARLEALT